MRRFRTPAIPLTLAVTLALTTPAFGATALPRESYAVAAAQIVLPSSDPHRVTRATIDKAKHDARLTLANGNRFAVVYPAGDDKLLVDMLIKHHVHPIYAKRPAVHHTLRYVAAGVVAVLLLIGAGVWAYTRGRPQERFDEQPTAPPADPRADGDDEPEPSPDAGE
jgi:hypothetical protein